MKTIQRLDAYKLATPDYMFNNDTENEHVNCAHCTEPTDVTTLMKYRDVDEVCAKCYKIAPYCELLYKAEKKLMKIVNSECLIYKLAGGYFEHQKDIIQAEKVVNRIENRIKELSK